MHGWDTGWGCGWMGFGGLVLLLVLGVFAWLVVMTVQRSGAGLHRDSAEQLLKQRYARGEVDRETYHRVLEELRR